MTDAAPTPDAAPYRKAPAGYFPGVCGRIGHPASSFLSSG